MHIQFRNARWHRAANTILALVTIGMLGTGLFIGTTNKRNITNIGTSLTENTKAIAEVKASQDLSRQQYLTYIHDTIEAMNRLQQDNASPELVKKRGVKVPRWPVLRPPDTSVTESDLRRIPQPSSASTPSPVIKHEKVYITKKPMKSPTPKPFKWPWDNPRRTR